MSSPAQLTALESPDSSVLCSTTSTHFTDGQN